MRTPRPTPAWAWVALLMCLVSGVVMAVAVVGVYHRLERCVSAVMLAKGSGASTWAAVETCHDPRTTTP